MSKSNIVSSASHDGARHRVPLGVERHGRSTRCDFGSGIELPYLAIREHSDT